MPRQLEFGLLRALKDFLDGKIYQQTAWMQKRMRPNFFTNCVYFDVSHCNIVSTAFIFTGLTGENAQNYGL